MKTLIIAKHINGRNGEFYSYLCKNDVEVEIHENNEFGNYYAIVENRKSIALVKIVGICAVSDDYPFGHKKVIKIFEINDSSLPF